MRFPAVSPWGSQHNQKSTSPTITPKQPTSTHQAEQAKISQKDAFHKVAPTTSRLTFSGDTPLLDAVRTNDLNTIRANLVKGENIHEKDKNGNKALHVLAKNIFPNTDALALLLKTGIDPNEKNLAGQTPLEVLVRNPVVDIEFLEMLLTAPQIDVNLPDRGKRTPLHHLAANLNHDVEKLQLLATLPDIKVNLKDKVGKTPLDYLFYPRYTARGLNRIQVFIDGQAVSPNIDSVKALLKAGATIKDNEQRRQIFDLALANQDAKLVDSVFNQDLVLSDMDKKQVFDIALEKNHARLMSRILKQGAKIGPNDDPTDQLANRLLKNRNNYLKLKHNLGLKTHSIIKQILALDIEPDIKPVVLSNFREKGQNPRKVANKIVKNIFKDFQSLIQHHQTPLPPVEVKARPHLVNASLPA